jgi:8-oxo-dGTP diphosphatase
MQGDGDGWLECGKGHRHWGRFGAAGLLLYTADHAQAYVLLQHRASWCHHGDTWGVPGGARDSHETALTAALREAEEEAGIDEALVTVHREVIDDHDGWTYTTVVGHVPYQVETEPNHESLELRWHPIPHAETLALHPGFGATWPGIRARGVRVLVDTANVVGSKPDGWWRDRAGATARVLEQLPAVVSSVVRLPDDQDAVVVSVTAVLEGAAREALDVPGITTVRAPGSGDDALVDQAEAGTADELVVVTADRGLRARLPYGATVVGPSWLTSLTRT